MIEDDTKARAPDRGSAAARAWEIRRARMRLIIRRFAFVVGIPTALAIVYYTLWAADEYVSEAVVSVHAPSTSSDALGDGNFVANRGADLNLVRQTIYSQRTLDKLIAESGWREHYSEHGDLFSRLGGDGSEETFNYFREHVQVSGPNGSPLRLRVRAFTGEAAAGFAGALLEIAEARVNEIALEPIDEQLAIARTRLAAAKKALAAAPPPPPPPAGATEKPTPSPQRIAATERLAAAEAVVARLELVRAGQARYLTVISGPSLPDEARYPKRVWGIATVFVVAFALMGIFSLLFGAVREHAKV